MAINLNDLANALTGAQERPAEPRASRDQYGTIALDAQGTPTVMLDGGTDYAPCTCMVGVHHGDRVLAHVVNHKIVVFANITAPTTDDAQALVAIDKADAAAEAADAAGIAAASAQADATQAKADAATARTAAQGAVADAAQAKQAATQASADAAQAAQDAASAASSAQSAQEDAASAATAATNAQGSASTAAAAATNAQASASQAATSASNAETSASQAAASAGNAQTSASQAATAATNAQTSAGQAATAAQNAQQQAGAATTAANEAKADAATAKSQAASAVADAAQAKQAATDATTAANGAVAGLATVQQVVDGLEDDVDELQVHVAMMDAYGDGHGGTIPAGLHVVPTGSGYFLVIANDGTYVYDAQSVLVTKFGESIDFSSTRPQRIGNDTAYVEYYDSDNDGVPDSIRISGTNLNTEISNFKQTVAETYATKSEAKQTASDSGKCEIVTEDAAELPLLTLTAYGECEQDGTPTPDAPVEIKAVRGKNLLDAAGNLAAVSVGLDKTASDDGKIRIAGTATAGWAYITQKISVNLPAGAYTLSLSKTMPYRVYAAITYADGTTFNALIDAGNTARAWTADNRIASLRITASVMTTGTTYDDTVGIQLESGTIATPYIPYGCISATTTGKNLVPPAAGIGRIQANGTPYTAAGDGDLHRYSPYIPVQPNTQYTLSVDYSQLDGNKYLPIAWYAKDGTFISRPYNWSGAAYIHQTFTSPSNAAYARTAAREECYETSLQLELGTEATEYESYRESAAYIDLKGHDLHGLDETYRDELEIDASGHAVIHKRTKHVVLDGSESWTHCTYTAGHGYYARFSSLDLPQPSGLYGNTMVASSVATRGDSVHAPNNSVYFAGSDTVADFDFIVNDYATVTDWKAYLAESPAEMVYAPKESDWYDIDLGYIDLPTAFADGTLHVSAEVQPVIDASWWTKAGYEAGKAFNDGNRAADLSELEERVTTAESSITQQAGQIALKANAADVNTKAETTALLEVKANKATLTSEINASADTVKIDADRVNITGEAVFSAINGDTSTTKINGGKVDADTLHVNAANIDGSLTIGKVDGLQVALDGKASTTDVANAAKRTYVSIRATAIDYAADTATLEATLYIDGTAKTSGVTYAWLLDGTAISGATSRTYSVPASSGLSHAYSCKCTATI